MWTCEKKYAACCFHSQQTATTFLLIDALSGLTYARGWPLSIFCAVVTFSLLMYSVVSSFQTRYFIVLSFLRGRNWWQRSVVRSELINLMSAFTAISTEHDKKNMIHDNCTVCNTCCKMSIAIVKDIKLNLMSYRSLIHDRRKYTTNYLAKNT